MTSSKYATADLDTLERLIVSPQFAMQEKIDGERLTVRITEDGIFGFNKRGERITVARPVHEELALLPHTPWHLDGEYAAGGYYIFDLIEAPVESVSTKPFDERLNIITIMVQNMESETLQVVPASVAPKDKLRLLLKLSLINAEGAVFRPTREARAFAGQVYKYKFRNTVDAVVMEANVDGKASMEVGVYRDNELVSIGKCTMLQPVQKGDVVEISYRRLSPNGRMIEPVMSRVRTDKFSYACVWAQLVEGKHLQDEALLDRQARRIADALGMDAEDLHELINTL